MPVQHRAGLAAHEGHDRNYQGKEYQGENHRSEDVDNPLHGCAERAPTGLDQLFTIRYAPLQYLRIRTRLAVAVDDPDSLADTYKVRCGRRRPRIRGAQASLRGFIRMRRRQIELLPSRVSCRTVQTTNISFTSSAKEAATAPLASSPSRIQRAV